MVYWSTGHWFHRGSLVAGYWRPVYVLVTQLLVTWLLVVGFAPGYWLAGKPAPCQRSRLRDENKYTSTYTHEADWPAGWQANRPPVNGVDCEMKTNTQAHTHTDTRNVA